MPPRHDRELGKWKGYAIAIVATVLATAIGWPLYHGLELPQHDRPQVLIDANVLMLYLLGVLWVAGHHSRGAAIFASILSVATFDFCFVPPYLTFVVADRQYLFTFAVMLITALTTSNLTLRVRRHADEAKHAWERVESEFMRNVLLSGISHDLRTPLAAITGAVTSLIETGSRLSADSRTELLETIHSQSLRMERLVNNLLDMTRLESGTLQLKRHWQHLQECIGAAVRNFEPRLGEREVRVSIPVDLPLVLIDDSAMEQIVGNLLDNAVNHAPAQHPIEIAARSEGQNIVIEVLDRGPGLPAGAERRVFEKFFRAAASERSGTQGVGLGLAICKGLVEAHGGQITAFNRDGGGAVFRITLPIPASAPRLPALEAAPL
jgi:two-component system sensor histidine kinase KdpD